eukprot:574676-Pleurochrysis_carterae.AAC.1
MCGYGRARACMLASGRAWCARVARASTRVACAHGVRACHVSLACMRTWARAGVHALVRARNLHMGACA